MNTIVQHYWNRRQPDVPGDCLPPVLEDAEVWIGARVEFPFARSSEWGHVTDARLDRRGYVWLHIAPDDARLVARWRALRDILSVD